MSQDGEGDFLSRWSRRKKEARARAGSPDAPPVPAGPAAIAASTSPAPAGVAGSPSAAPPEPRPPLPPVESLTPESDFTPFMRPDVDPGLRQQALRTLVRDPRFNIMDGLDVYIDDYSKPDPIPADWMGKLNQLARLGDFAKEPEPEETAEALDSDSPEAANDEPKQEDGDESGAPAADISGSGPTPPQVQES